MKNLVLRKGQVVLLDDEDLARVAGFTWYVNAQGYVVSLRENKRLAKLECVSLHRVILKAPKGRIVDHINGNPLDNRRSNLRLVTLSQNAQNRKRHKNNKSGVKGVIWHKGNKAWRASIMINGKAKHLGSFQDLQEAGQAYRNASEKFFGTFNRSHT